MGTRTHAARTAARSQARGRGRRGRARGLDPDALPERGRDPGGLHPRGAGGARAAPASRARCSSPTMAAPTARRRWPARPARGWSQVAARGYGNALAGGIAAAQRPLRPDGRRRRLLRLRRAAQVPRRTARRRRSGHGLPAARRAAAGSCRAPCPGSTAGSATRCSTALGRLFFTAPGRTTSTAACAHSAATPCSGLGLHMPGHGVRLGDGGQGHLRAACASPRCR